MSPAISAERPRGPIKSERNRAAAASRSTFADPVSSTSSAFHKKRAQGRSNYAIATSRSQETNANKDCSAESSNLKRHSKKESGADAPAQVKDNQGDSDENDDENEDDDDEDDDDDVRSKTALSLSGHQLPPLAALVDTLAQFSFLQRLDLSSIEPSDASPKGLDTLTWLAKAVFRSNTSAKGKGRAFGDHLTWLNLSSNPNLTSEACIGLEALEELCVLTLSHCALTTVPPSITPLRNLKALVLNNNSISHLPETFPHLPELNSLILSHNEITTLPASLPASLPALKKLSLGHNKLKGSESLPDFSLCLSLREVRLNDNPEVKSLPSHVKYWGKGADGKTAPGLELLELKDCGLDTWEALSTLGEAEDERESQPRLRRKGLTQLLLKGNGVAMENGFKEKILEVHPTLRVLDNERLQPRVRPEDREVDDSDANGKKKKARTQSKPERRGRDVVEEQSADGESDDDEAAQMAAEMRALRRGKPEPKSSSKKGRKQESDNEDSDAHDDNEAAQMAAEMRALRRGQAIPRNSAAKKDSSKSKSKQQSEPVEGSEDTDRAKPKHKRGTRSGKKVNKTEGTADKSSDRSDRGFFEAVDAAEEKVRLAPIYELSKKRAKIASGRTQVAEGVLEDATSSLSKARQKESKGRTELDTFDDTAPEPAKSATPKAQAKKPKQKSDDKAEDRKVNTSVAGIVDLRKQAKSQRDADMGKKRKVNEKEAEGTGKKKARTSLPFMAAAKGVGEGGKTATSEAIGSGTDAWGAGGAWA